RSSSVVLPDPRELITLRHSRLAASNRWRSSAANRSFSLRLRSTSVHPKETRPLRLPAVLTGDSQVSRFARGSDSVGRSQSCGRKVGGRHMRRLLISGGIVLALWPWVSAFSGRLRADAPQAPAECPVSHETLGVQVSAADAADSTGLNNHYWAVVVNRAGVVCAVAFSGPAIDSQWLVSRQIAAAKAFTANGLSLDSAPISTAQLYPWVQPGAPGNPLFGLAAGNPVSPEAAYE